MMQLYMGSDEITWQQTELWLRQTNKSHSILFINNQWWRLIGSLNHWIDTIFQNSERFIHDIHLKHALFSNQEEKTIHPDTHHRKTASL